MRRSKLHSALACAAGLLLLALIIQAASALKGDRLVFPSVPAILRALGALLSRPKTWKQIGTTLVHLLLCMGISTCVGILIGLAEGILPLLRQLLRPAMTLLRSLPMIVLIILLMVVSDYRHVPVLAGCFVLVPLISEAACEGCLRIEPELMDVWRLNSRLSLPVIRQVYLPLMAGYLKQSYVNAAGMGLKLAVTAEYLVQTRDSLGKAVYSSVYFNEYAEVYAYALIMVALVLLLSEAPLLLVKNAPDR